MPKNNLHKGFTMVEVLIVIAILTVVSSITIGTLNVTKQRDIARDASTRATLEKLSTAINAYHEGEDNTFPDAGSSNNPLDASAATAQIASTYIQKWPAGFIYTNNVNAFSIQVLKESTNTILKYSSVWDQIRECTSSTPAADVTACTPLANATCGDSVCSGTETCASCSLDCGTCSAVCGDSQCTGTETAANCPSDCQVCGDGNCNGTETVLSCPGDCPHTCGDSLCTGTENASTCPGDCTQTCGDSLCTGTENVSTCPVDCQVCGDGVCNGTESVLTCSSDCPVVCGDSICSSSERCNTCIPDCGTCVNCTTIAQCTAYGNTYCESNRATCPGYSPRRCRCLYITP